jgi:hypothetical protein
MESVTREAASHALFDIAEPMSATFAGVEIYVEGNAMKTYENLVGGRMRAKLRG